MSATRRGLALRDLGRLFRNGALPSGDGALLECFLAEGNESAFEAIVARHGPMVLGVCRRLLGDPHDADDAFQATLSWRVALLPFLDRQALFQAFHLDESWDSPHNQALIARMPDVFTTPSSPAADGTSRIRLFEDPVPCSTAAGA
jgi:Protein of unknown function (DUF1559)/Sigma-70 region 2